jgi:hypothetical protein
MNANPAAAKIAAPPAPQALRDLMRQPARAAFQVAINNLYQAHEALQGSPGGDLGGLRAKIEQDIAAAIETIMAIDQAQNSGRGRGGRGRGAETQ